MTGCKRRCVELASCAVGAGEDLGLLQVAVPERTSAKQCVGDFFEHTCTPQRRQRMVNARRCAVTVHLPPATKLTAQARPMRTFEIGLACDCEDGFGYHPRKCHSKGDCHDLDELLHHFHTELGSTFIEVASYARVGIGGVLAPLGPHTSNAAAAQHTDREEPIQLIMRN